jgi:hypothetical protein
LKASIGQTSLYLLTKNDLTASAQGFGDRIDYLYMNLCNDVCGCRLTFVGSELPPNRSTTHHSQALIRFELLLNADTFDRIDHARRCKD